MMLDGKTGDLNNAIQRPFVVDFEVEHGVPRPIVKILEDGVHIRLLAKLPHAESEQSSSIQLTAEIVANQVLGIRSDQLFGLTDEPLEIQVPLYATKQVIVSERLLKGQSILVDPHVTKPETLVAEVETSMLGKLPYIGRRFREAETGTTIDRNVLVLMRPAKVPR